MFVVGANNENQFSLIREKLPNHFLLVPGIGAQGGDLQKVIQQGINKDGGHNKFIKGIIYASKDEFLKNVRQKKLKVKRSNG